MELDVVVCTCNQATLEEEFQTGVGSVLMMNRHIKHHHTNLSVNNKRFLWSINTYPLDLAPVTSHFTNFVRSLEGYVLSCNNAVALCSCPLLHGNLPPIPHLLALTPSTGLALLLQIVPSLPHVIDDGPLPQPFSPCCFYVVPCPLNFEHFWFYIAYRVVLLQVD